ncbi:MAG: glycosyltransferase [Steroidobacteraceae bacterium]
MHGALPLGARAAAALPLLIWLYLLGARGRFWRVARHLPRAQSHAPRPASAAAAPGRRVVAVIPARNEADVIGAAVGSLLRQELAGPIHVIVVDDASTDGTAGAALAAAAAAGAAQRLTILDGAPLAAGWSGKLWAMSQGIAGAAVHHPDYLLLTDADIEHERENIALLVARAEAQGLDLLSSMVRLSTATFPERCLIPAFVFFFFKLYPPAWIASPRARTAGAAGGCMLIRPQALSRIGGLAAIRTSIIDDCALAVAVKASGGSISLGLSRTARSLRVYGSFAQIGRMIARTAFQQLRHSYLLLAVTLLGLAVTYLAPPLLLLTGDPLTMTLGAGAWALMTLAYLPMVRFYRLPALWAAALPAIAAFYAGATLWSAVQYRLGRGGRWKGRVQDARAAG